MEYTEEQWVEIFNAIMKIDNHAAVFFIGSVSDDHTNVEFNFVSRLENNEDTVDVINALQRFVSESSGPTDIIQQHQKPDLKIVDP